MRVLAMRRYVVMSAMTLASTLGAQSPRADSSAADLLLVGELGRVPSGIRVRVRARTATFEGHVDSLSFDRLVVGGNTGGRIGLTEIDSVWVKQRNTRRFAKRGAYILGLSVASWRLQTASQRGVRLVRPSRRPSTRESAMAWCCDRRASRLVSALSQAQVSVTVSASASEFRS